MSSAHRPTWSPAIGKGAITNSKLYSVRDIAAHTRLKFRQPGQGNQSEIARRDLKLELLSAERDSSTRKAKGLPGFVPSAKVLSITAGSIDTTTSTTVDPNEAILEAAAAKRRKILAEVGDLDKDDEDDEVEEVNEGVEKGKGKAVESMVGNDDDDDSEESSDDDEDETAELLRELEKIKRERAEEKERIEREKASNEQTSREEEIATGNPLLNLASALNFPASPAASTISSSSTSTSSSFGIKRRWDDDVIFKNQARGTTETPKSVFINDLLRSNYHARFLKRHIA